MDKQKQIEELSQDIKSIAADWTASCEYSCDNCPWGSCRGKIATLLVNAGYRKESDTVKEVLEKVLTFAAEDEVGLKYLIRKTAREYGVELGGTKA